MNFRKKTINKDLELNITPLIDIVFLLLIFFMVSTNFNKFTQLNLSLPQVSKSYNDELPLSINLKITSKGSYFINDTPLSHNDKRTLVIAIKRYSENNSKLPFIISGDAKAPHQAVVQALDAASELGFTNVRIAAVRTY
jgi:biopolymer transport protein ExbD